MRKFLLAFFLFLFLLFPNVVEAQQAIEFDSVQISIWPEYDRPDLLVLYDLMLSSQTSLPANLQIRLPRSAGEPYALAMRGADGGLTNLSYESRIDGDWTWLSFTTPALEVRIEYYDPVIQRDGDQHSFTYTWPGDYHVRSMKIQVQQPASASTMETQISQVSTSGEASQPLDMGSGRTGEDGLVYFDSLIGEIVAGNSVEISSTYQKADDLLSFSSQPVQPSQPLTAETAGRTNLTGLIPWILGTLGLLLIAGGAFWYWQSGHDISLAEKKHRPRRREPPIAQSESSEIYCHQCGKRAGANDIYCRVCGTKLRVE